MATARSSAITTPKKPQIITGPCSAAADAAVSGMLQPSRASPAPVPTSRPRKPSTSSGTRHAGGRPVALAGGADGRLKPALPPEVIARDPGHLVRRPRRVPDQVDADLGVGRRDRG